MAVKRALWAITLVLLLAASMLDARRHRMSEMPRRRRLPQGMKPRSLLRMLPILRNQL